MRNQPLHEQIADIKELLCVSIDELIRNDTDIFDIELFQPRRISPDAKILIRELHETTINHRFAFYLESNIQDKDLKFYAKLGHYKVDVEYNRFYNNPKILEGINGIVRPDIIVHTRTNHDVEQQHYLVVEAKKAQISPHDINKIKSFVTDDNYNYLFGLTISYCSNESHILSDLYYFNGKDVVSEPIYIPKNN